MAFTYRKKHRNFNESLGRLVAFTMLSVSTFVILSTFADNAKKHISQERLRQSYDGLSPHDYF